MKGSWTAADLDFDATRYPVVPEVQFLPPCRQPHPVGYFCTRPRGHTGRHLAVGTGNLVHAVWGDDS